MKDRIEKLGKYAVYTVSVILLTSMSMTSCSIKANDKLKIEGKIYTISIGEIKYDAENRLVSIAVLADGQPLQNKTEYRSSSINVGGQQVMSSVSALQPVKMFLMVKGRGIPASDGISSEDGIFTFEVEELPDIIEVATDFSKNKTTVCFNAKTKELMSSKEYDLYLQEWIMINRKADGLD